MRTLLISIFITSVSLANAQELEHSLDYRPDYLPDYQPDVTVTLDSKLVTELARGSRIVTVERTEPDYMRRLLGQKDATRTVTETYIDQPNDIAKLLGLW